MKVTVHPKSESTITNSIHTSLNSLTEMLKTNSNIVKNPVKINKEDNYQRMFNRAISRTIRERQLLS